MQKIIRHKHDIYMGVVFTILLCAEAIADLLMGIMQ